MGGMLYHDGGHVIFMKLLESRLLCVENGAKSIKMSRPKIDGQVCYKDVEFLFIRFTAILLVG